MAANVGYVPSSMLLSLLCLAVGLLLVGADEPSTTTTAGELTTSSGDGGAALLQLEGQRLAELSKQVADTNRALEELLATKLRDVHYATVIGELRSEIDALR